MIEPRYQDEQVTRYCADCLEALALTTAMTDKAIMTTWFTADHYFDHENIISYAGRPFESVGEMNRALIDFWNHVVSPSDHVYHLGDFTLGDAKQAQKFFGQLNGRISVLANLWHHDRRWLSYDIRFITKSGADVELLPPMYIIELPREGQHPLAITLCHYPLAEWDRKHYGALCLHGHSHGKYRANGRIMDVGVDNIGFRPVSLEEICKYLLDKPI
jgi:calcineurin-like phosphoesterase family protein